MNLHVKHVDEGAWRALQMKAERLGLPLGEAVTRAFRTWTLASAPVEPTPVEPKARKAVPVEPAKSRDEVGKRAVAAMPVVPVPKALTRRQTGRAPAPAFRSFMRDPKSGRL